MEPTANNNVNMYSMNQPPQKSRKGLVVGIVVVVLLLIGGLIVYSLLGSNTPVETSQNTTPALTADELQASVSASITNDQTALDQEVSSINPASLDQN